ncbi:clotting factor G beta subunit-like [Malaya genurostris]|uniref:clotting factor G beta subunit-like n=1 Tax=Malaya genurostris TaxID=325434 RepID=UPI0026F3B4C8|nr:clotting factor G beta subunit-like [Malaya genurostris]
MLHSKVLSFVVILLSGQARCYQSCGERQVKTRNLITNSFEVQPGDYPWHAAVYQRFPIKQYICGGTLVGQSVIITSAHCVSVPGHRQAKSNEDLVVQVGKHLLIGLENGSEREYSLSSVIVHETSGAEQNDHDIALLITAEPVRYGKFVQPACLPTFSLIHDKTAGTIVGWGYTEQNTVSNVLKAANLPIVTKDACIRSNPGAFANSVTDNMFCAGHRNGTNACNGDSGGGFFRSVRGRWYLVGIISFTAAKKQNENLCSSTDYTAFVNVAKYEAWIRKRSDSNFGSLCPDGNPISKIKAKKQYFVHNNKEVTFLEAWRLCQAVGHQLATITSEEDSALIEQAIAKSSNKKGPWYIAGTDLGNEGQFVWISTNKPVGYLTGYFNYSPGQPDNAGGNENCLEIGRWGGVVWNDVPCDWKQRYICEYVGWNF